MGREYVARAHVCELEQGASLLVRYQGLQRQQFA